MKVFFCYGETTDSAQALVPDQEEPYAASQMDMVIYSPHPPKASPELYDLVIIETEELFNNIPKENIPKTYIIHSWYN